jgi:hypothetical protein
MVGIGLIDLEKIQVYIYKGGGEGKGNLLRALFN